MTATLTRSAVPAPRPIPPARPVPPPRVAPPPRSARPAAATRPARWPTATLAVALTAAALLTGAQLLPGTGPIPGWPTAAPQTPPNPDNPDVDNPAATDVDADSAAPDPTTAEPIAEPAVVAPEVPVEVPALVEGLDYAYLEKVDGHPVRWPCTDPIRVAITGPAPAGAHQSLHNAVAALAAVTALRAGVSEAEAPHGDRGPGRGADAGRRPRTDSSTPAVAAARRGPP